MSYTQLTINSVVVYIKDSNGATIPLDEDNIDYVKYLEWVDDGGEPDQEALD